MSRYLIYTIVLVLLASAPAAAEWPTYAESTGYDSTPDYAATMSYLHDLARQSRWIHIGTFGTTPRGRPMHYVIVSSDRAFTPSSVTRTNKLVVLIQNGIHSGEIDGKDACLALVRDMAVTKERAALLDSVIPIIIPVFNIDGHEMMSPYNRINQDGPSEMGFRATGQNYNLNRDYLKVDAPEMRALVELWNTWQPHFFIDNHVTDGADFQYALTYTITRHDNGARPVKRWGNEIFVPIVTGKMDEAGEPIFPYVVTMGRPLREGIIDFVESPRYSTGYAAVRNRPGLLVEMHMLKPYGRRVVANYKMMVAVLELLNEQTHSLRRATFVADSLDEAGLSGAVPLAFTRADEPTEVDFLGFEYETRTSEVSGGEWIWYDTTQPLTMRLPYYNQMIPTLEITAPHAYLIPQEWTEVIERLRLHGIRMQRLDEAVSLAVETYRFDSVSWAAESYEGHHLVRCRTHAVDSQITYPAGTVFVPLAQAGARLIMHALEPDGRDSFFRWGFFDTMLEQKEYSERYASEALAHEMLATNPAIRAEFEARLESDSAFAADPSARWNFFYEQSPYAEPMLNVYPVGRLMHAAAVKLTKY